MEQAVDGSPRDAVGLGDLAEALPAPAILEDRIAIEQESGAADPPAFEPSAPHAGLCSLDGGLQNVGGANC